MALQQPLLLRLEFAFPLENANHIIGKVIGSLNRPKWKCSYGKYSITLIVQTDESSWELVKRLALDQISGIEDYTCHVAPIGAICKHGGMNTLHTALDKAWDAVGKRGHPEYVRQTKRFDPRVERRVQDRESGAIREVKIETPSVRQPPKYPNRP